MAIKYLDEIRKDLRDAIRNFQDVYGHLDRMDNYCFITKCILLEELYDAGEVKDDEDRIEMYTLGMGWWESRKGFGTFE